MKWYYTIAGGHTHVRVFMNGAKCGDLCFRNDEFNEIKKEFQCETDRLGFKWLFINETKEQ